jgi:large subunit ribosomal protein L9
MRATKENLAIFETQKAQLEASNLKRREEAEYVAKTMDGVQIVIIRQASEVGHLYGSVRTQDISEGLTAKGFTVARTQVHIPAPIKTLGFHTVKVILHPEVSVDVKLNIAQSMEEAQAREAAQAAA